MTFSRRLVDEQMDAPDLDPDVHRLALAGLRRLNRVSGVSSVLYRRLLRLAPVNPKRPMRVLDVASGGGDLPVAWLVRARRQGFPLEVTALDRSETALAAAAAQAKRANVDLTLVQRDCLAESLPGGFDVVTCSLFMHHLSEPQGIRLIQEMWRASRRSVVICDLERSRLNLALVAAASRLVSRSEVVHHDAVASVRGAFTREELADLFQHAFGFTVPIRRSLPCRMLAVLEQSCEVERVEGLAPAVAGAVA